MAFAYRHLATKNTNTAFQLPLNQPLILKYTNYSIQASRDLHQTTGYDAKHIYTAYATEPPTAAPHAPWQLGAK